MKKAILTMVAFVAFTAASFGQYSSLSSLSNLSSISSLPSIPTISSVPTISSIPSIPTISSISYPVNLNTTIVSGYVRSNGIYVDPYVRTMPNNTNWDNFSTFGNTNPITGTSGYRARDYSNDAFNYGIGHTIHIGPRGGQYYYNSHGNKTYVPKQSLW